MTCPFHAYSEKIDGSLPRPDNTITTTECISCGDDIEVTLRWMKCMNDGCEGKYWIKDDVDHLPRNDYFCTHCLEERIHNLARARELEADCPPEWFDESDIGERWNEEGY